MIYPRLLLAACFLVCCGAAPAVALGAPRPDTVIADFEDGYGDWQATGDAFGDRPPAGALPGQMPVDGFSGRGLVNSFRGGDQSTGTLASPEFTLERPYLTMLIGGGGHRGETCVDLCIDGQAVRTATGPNLSPGGSERLARVYWDVRDLAGARVTFRVVDRSTAGWGHVNVDDLRATDQPDGAPARESGVEQDLRTFDSYSEVGYNQPLRPRFHFTSRKHWLNDPNGMVYLDGEYHLFFQHNPAGVQWGHMTWGHAVSPDMVHWRQLPHAILPYGGGTIYSGTAVIDANNTLGVPEGDSPTMVAAFTHARSPFTQALAYSTDRGRTFQLHNHGRPILPNQGYDDGERDPKVFWHEDSQQWVMVLWVQQGTPGRVLVLNSPDLQNWEVASHFDRDWVFECMDLVQLSVDGDPDDQRWLLYDASFEYELGTFDGRTLETDRVAHRGEYGPNYYAAQTFNNAPDGRTVIIGWMRGGDEPFVAAGMPFNQQMSFPCTMELRTTADGVRLFRWPIQEIESLWEESVELDYPTIAAANTALEQLDAAQLDLSITFAADQATTLAINLRGERIEYHESAFWYAGVRLPAPPVDGRVSLRALVDRASIELFANHGQAVSSHYAKLDPSSHKVELTPDPTSELIRVEAHRVGSIWEE
ncbi:Levanase precursor [Posidoniimonas polymericola]|uniref:Levanase n=1 Tax=Posidoniimonas polymericola TaxID=2528002 RepID=A0A5C5YEE3_9BACT|nr:glycoside hydrolase family 32 protein [Posidoniimonas polymericola]TWT72675.1 Levanase precursor [Posidoniimonas polymericola]